ncbi:hypothetical protein EC991_002968 [Linnemannia zychae]|nr:hypothetical protein EC991_002968 [Linnemannia zychae]
MPRSAKGALILVRTNIAGARDARGSERIVVKNYRTAKKALDKVDIKKTEDGALKDIIAAFKDLAQVLDDSGAQFQERATKRTLHGRKFFGVAGLSPLVKARFSRPSPQTGINHLRVVTKDPSVSNTTISIADALTVTSCKLSTVSPGSTTTFTPRPQTHPSIQVPVSISAARVTLSQPFFNTDVSPISCIGHFPGPDEPLQTTHQLAYCLALLQDSAQENELTAEAIEWRRRALSNLDERNRLVTLSVQIINMFAVDPLKSASTVDEVVQLASVLDKEYSQRLITIFINTLNQSELLHLHSLEGLAKAIQEAAPGSIDSNDLVAILRSLHKKLQLIHSESVEHRLRLLYSVSCVLDAMVDAQVESVERVDLHEPLTELLRESESSKDLYLTFQTAYATQALLNVSNDENIWQAGFRRGWLVLKGAAKCAKLPEPLGIKDALEVSECLYEVGKGGARFLKSAMESIRKGERPTFTVRDGLKFKEAWYYVLRMAERDIQTGQLVRFKELVTSSSCRHQFLFQFGICLLLGRFAADIQWELNARREALTFLRALHKDNTLWDRQKGVDRVTFDMLISTKFNINIPSEDIKSLLKELQQQNPALRSALESKKSLDSQYRRFIAPTYPVPHITSKATLLASVQDEMLRHAKVMNLPDPPARPHLNGIYSAITAYHAPDLFIQRVSGEELDLEVCFVNLAIVEARTQREQEKKDLKEQATVFRRIQSFERVRNTDTKSLIPLEQLFEKRKLQDGKEGIPKRILVQGRAGIGKTVLCKKLVHGYQNGLWRNRFDIILWIPLRRLKGTKSRSLEGLFCEKVFVGQDSDQEQALLSRELLEFAKKGKVLFILDGLDEIVTDAGDDGTFRTLLIKLLSQQNVIITSRPSGLDSKLLPSLDLELETIGFSTQNVQDFIVNVLKPEEAERVQDFIQHTPLIQGLVNIPVQLDVICFSWDKLPTDGPAVTMTGLYQVMVRKLWCKDALRLQKKGGQKYLTESQINRLNYKGIDGLMATELRHLGYLAFKGMTNMHQIEFDDMALLSAFEDIEDYTDNGRRLPPQLVEDMKDTSFLHSADTSIESRKGEPQQAWHFLHLTFQEYFAATWIVRHFHLQSFPSIGMKNMEQMTEFVHQHKYNPRYEIVWPMVAGLLEGEALDTFFELLEGSPRDLIGGRHQQILASCLSEARDRLDSDIVADLDLELANWLCFEMETGEDGLIDRSLLGSQDSFPEGLLIETLSSMCSKKGILIDTLMARSVRSDSAIQYLTAALMDEVSGTRSSAARALAEETSLPESTIQSLVAALKDECSFVRSSALVTLGKQSMLTEYAIRSLICALKDKDRHDWESVASAISMQFTSESAIRFIFAALEEEVVPGVNLDAVLSKQFVSLESKIQALTVSLQCGNPDARCLAALALGRQSLLPESALQSLIIALKDEWCNVRSSAASALGKQSMLPEYVIWCLISALKDKNLDVRSSAAKALGKQSILLEAAIKSLIIALKDESSSVSSSAATALGKHPALPEFAIQSLTATLNGREAYHRHLVASVLGKQSTLPDFAIQALIILLQDKRGFLQDSAAKALRGQSILPDYAIQSLLTAIEDENEQVGFEAAWALYMKSTLPEFAVQSLIITMDDENVAWRARELATLTLTYP